MNKLFVIAGALAVAATVLPAGAIATWYSMGTYEPDTEEDLTGFMQTDPHYGAGDQVYFNAYPTEYLTSTNPNNAELGSRVLVPGVREYKAVLGPWKDCNGDGYVGLQESAAWSYPSALLIDSSTCAVGSMYNDGQWVHEYLPIGRIADDDEIYSKYIIDDDESLVWGDFGLPGAAAAQTCPIVPPPHGTTAGTGATIRWIDCLAGKRITTTVNTVDPNGDLGIGFEDANNPQNSDSVLNQELPESLWGNPRTCETGAFQLAEETNGCPANDAAFTTYDCSSSAPLVVVPDPTSTDGDNLAEVYTPAPSTSVDPTGSYSMGVNNTVDGVEGCSSTKDDDPGNDYATVHGTAFFYTDGAVGSGTQNPQKWESDIGFGWTDGGVQSDCVSDEDLGIEETCARGAVFGERMPDGFGLGPLHELFDAYWGASTVYVTTPQSINRNTLQPQPALFLTFYGKIGAASSALGLSGLSSGVYGSEICGSDFTTDTNPNDGWNCNAAEWNIENGADISTEFSSVVGMPYQFRDIDCDDGTVAKGTGVRASLVDLTATACAEI